MVKLKASFYLLMYRRGCIGYRKRITGTMRCVMLIVQSVIVRLISNYNLCFFICIFYIQLYSILHLYLQTALKVENCEMSNIVYNLHHGINDENLIKWHCLHQKKLIFFLSVSRCFMLGKFLILVIVRKGSTPYQDVNYVALFVVVLVPLLLKRRKKWELL